mgnify:CR=1 FL=1
MSDAGKKMTTASSVVCAVVVLCLSGAQLLASGRGLSSLTGERSGACENAEDVGAVGTTGTGRRCRTVTVGTTRNTFNMLT